MDGPLKWHGGKAYLARRIVALMPPHLHYVEPFAGGLAVLLERDPNDPRLWVSGCAQRGGVSELANDLNGELINFWRALQHRELFAEFVRACRVTPLARAEYERAGAYLAGDACTPLARAHAFFVRCRQSRAGTFRGFTSLTRSRTRRGINGNASEWLGAVDGLAAVHARLEPVVLESMDALNLIRREDTPDTLFYCDPPYLHETRATPDAYAHEFTDARHVELLSLLAGLKGKWMLSGYPSPLYESFFKDYPHTLHTFDLPNHAAGGKSKRRMTECVWCNF